LFEPYLILFIYLTTITKPVIQPIQILLVGIDVCLDFASLDCVF